MKENVQIQEARAEIAAWSKRSAALEKILAYDPDQWWIESTIKFLDHLIRVREKAILDFHNRQVWKE